MLTRVQLNLLGRRSYLSSVISLATGTAQSTISLENNDDDDSPEHQVYGSDFDINRKYLTFSWWLLNKGWEELGRRVDEAVRDVFGHLSPRDLLSYETFTQLTLEVRKKIEGGDRKAGEHRGSKWLSIVLPPRDQEEHVLRESGVLGESAAAETQGSDAAMAGSSASLRRLLDETSDLIESPAFSHVLGLVLDAGFAVLHTQKLLPGAFELPAHLSPSIPELEDPEHSAKVVLLPKILSVLTRQAHAIGHGMMPNEYLQAMEQVPDLEAFAAVVYSSNWENEIQNEGEELAAASQSQKQEHKSAPGGGSAAAPLQEDSQMTEGVTSVGAGEESLVLVNPEPEPEPSQISSFERVWEKAQQQQPKEEKKEEKE